jgi:sarcosine oxidase / L-pipecolate oxidase
MNLQNCETDIACSGFKFLPILGKYTADLFERKASKELREQWALKLPDAASDGPMAGDGSRGGPPQRVLTVIEQAKL